ncbi:PilT/PilU family type 4a pilus ATPase [Iamia majanohamensis]|uniref:PilT/PilU family type 4a pilus ATPase n=1 Tax=Iamia majanohamensis TaxID=467976 RepID=A0AAF0BVY4_9ACTN|nr:PilT/PilU family type 4a pilus ATPase [Iamia majanohamensis]WCO66834.1 PilT/PilU family type 4a pilus ATPase [Iamia majanohamensis]
MLASQGRRFVEALVARHVITKQTAQEVLGEAATSGEPVDALVRRHAELGDKDLAIGHAAASGLRFVDLEDAVVNPEALAAVPRELADAHGVLGLDVDGHRVTVAFPMPADGEVMHAVSEALSQAGYEVDAVAGERAEIASAAAQLTGGPGAGGAATIVSAPEKRLVALIERTLELGASDLHLAADEQPFVRILGELVRMPESERLGAAEVRDMAMSIINGRQRARFEERRELDLAYAIPGRLRLRVNLYVQKGAVGMALRLIPFEVVPFDHIGMPPVVASLADLPRGLVLVTGPTGSGKSTTLASVIDLVNQRRQAHVVTIEDPIEFVHTSKTALVNQREVGDDTDGFNVALTQALRQDPDVVLVGEMRDLETVSTAITAAETGHLVFATLHTQDSSQTVDRIVDVFPPEQQAQVRTQLAATLQGIVAQQLLPTTDGRRRVPACEILLATPALRALIRDGKVHQIPNTITSGRKLGMQTLDESLADLVRSGAVDPHEAVKRARDPQGLSTSLGLGLVPTG